MFFHSQCFNQKVKNHKVNFNLVVFAMERGFKSLYLYKKRKTSRLFLTLRFWQRRKDSNPHIRSQSPLCYPYTTPLHRAFIAATLIIILYFPDLSMPFFHFLKKVSTRCATLAKGMVAAGYIYPAALYQHRKLFCYYASIFLKSSAPCLQMGQTKSAGSSSPSYS